MVGFGYGGNPLAGKSFDFGSAFGTAATGGSPEDIFDVRKYGGDIRSRNKSVGRRAAGDMSTVLTDQQIENLGAGLADIVGLVNQRTLYDGGIGSLNNEGALTNDRVNQYLQSGDILGATGWSGVDAGSAFGTMRANAQAARDAGNQDLYSAYTDPSNFNNLGILNKRTMGGVGQSMLYNALSNAQDAYGLGEDPYGAAGGSIFGQGQTARWVNPNQVEAEPVGEGTAPTPATPHTPETPGSPNSQPPAGGTPFGNQTPPMGIDDINQRVQAIESAFKEVQGVNPDPAQYNYINRIANTQGLEAALNFVRNNIVAQAIKATGQPAPKIRNSQDVPGANALHDFIVNALGPQVINQPREEYVRNLLSWYQSQGM